MSQRQWHPADELSLKSAWSFYLPLTLSWLMMFASQPIIQSGLARLPSPEVALAAYAMAFNAAVLLESPIFMVMPTANALVCDNIAYKRLRMWVTGFSVILSVNALIVAFVPPVYDFIFLTILSAPLDIATAARPGLQVLAIWPSIVAIRLFYQGILVRLGRTRIVTLGTGIRLVSMSVVLALGVAWFPDHGVVVGTGALLFGVIVDGLVAVIVAVRLLRTGVLPDESDEHQPASRDLRAFGAFFLPLAATSCLRMLSQPLMLGGIARSYQATLALAAWPVAMNSMWLLSGHLRMIQQVVLSLIKDEQSLALIRRFALIVALGFTLVTLVVVCTPLASLYHRYAVGLDGQMLTIANQSLRLLIFMPAIIALQAWAQGVLIKAGRTVPANIAALSNLIVAVGVLYGLAVFTDVPGHILASGVFVLAMLVEVGVVMRWAYPLMGKLWGQKQRDTAQACADR